MYPYLLVTHLLAAIAFIGTLFFEVVIWQHARQPSADAARSGAVDSPQHLRAHGADRGADQGPVPLAWLRPAPARCIPCANGNGLSVLGLFRVVVESTR